MTTLNIEGKQVQVDDSFLKLSPEDQDSTVADIAKSIGAGSPAGPAAAPDIGDGRASGVAMLRGVPIAGALADKATAGLNAVAQPFLETGMSHKPTISERYAENLPKVKAGTDAYEGSHPIGTTVSKFVAGAAPFAAAGAVPAAARVLGMTGTLPEMVGAGLGSGAAIGGADAAARGEDVGTGALSGAVTGGALPIAGRAVGAAARGVRNLVSSVPRTPRVANLNGVDVPVPESYVNPTNEIGSQEQMAKSGALGPEVQQVAQTANQQTAAGTQQAENQFGSELRGGPGPSQPLQPPHQAAEQTVTELAQQHNDQIQAQARHDAQIAAEGTSMRGDLNAPLGTPEPAQTPSSLDRAAQVQDALQARERASQANVNQRYQTAGQFPGSYHQAAFQNLAPSIRDRVYNATVGRGDRPVTINPQLTPHADAMLDMLDTRLGNNYYDNALRRGDMVRTPDGRVVPRPLAPADVEAARQELVGHLRDANSAARAPGGSGTDAYAAQRVMNAFDQHHAAVLQTPGAFRGDGQAYRAAIEAARAAHSQHKATFANQGGGDTVGPVIDRMTGNARLGQEMPPAQVAQALYGSPSAPGGGNSQQVAARALQILGPQSPEAHAMRQGLISHLLDVPEGMNALPPAKQADRLDAYLATPHARALLSDAQVARLRLHSNELRAQAQAAPAETGIARDVTRLATGATSPSEFVKKVFSSTGVPTPGAEKLLDAVHARVSQQTWNSIREAMWLHLTERAEGVKEFGPQALSQRLARFLASPAATSLYSDSERGVMRQFAEHYAKLTPLENTTNASGSATTAAKLVRAMGSHIMALVGLHTAGVPGLIVGESAQRAAHAMRAAQQVAKTKELFLGKKGSHPLNQNYSRAAAVLSHAATPLMNDHAAQEQR